MSVHFTCPSLTDQDPDVIHKVECSRHYGPCHRQGVNRKDLPDYKRYHPNYQEDES